VKIKNRWKKTRENLKIMTLGTLDLKSCYQNIATKEEFVTDMSLSFIGNGKEFPAELKKTWFPVLQIYLTATTTTIIAAAAANSNASVV